MYGLLITQQSSQSIMMKHSNDGKTADNLWLADAIAFNKASVDNKDGDVLPKMRPCSSVVVGSNNRRVSFQQENTLVGNKTQLSSRKNPPQLPSSASSYLSFEYSSDADDETICSSKLYSLKDYNPALKEARMKREEERVAKFAKEEDTASLSKNLICPPGSLGDIFVDVPTAFCDTFVITPEDIDHLADVIQDAQEEVVDIEIDRRLDEVRELEESLQLLG